MLAIQLKTHMHAKIMKKNVSRIVLGWLLYSQCDFLLGKQTRKTNEVFQSDDSLLLHFPMYCLCFWGIYKRAKSWFYHRSIAFSGLTVNFTSLWTVCMNEFNAWWGSNTVRHLRCHTNRGNKPLIWIQTDPVIQIRVQLKFFFFWCPTCGTCDCCMKEITLSFSRCDQMSHQ